ncbi:hypothetical protein [Deinococcus maricopensis]|uniref:Lipoprotein n=1 Tax=Deinococcus maricopensis (strain DSM 21211 / LMG 22137 / NRRL B-23946 / LB-34) TaxID=709986 RepID=E8UB96_DEIML|nr:hypothetical protein [Deinococcus maricopensis]ADV68335.1 hypothetical protein Deima_2705 [Deinococcus maricopensis DSM 21211]
MKRAFLLVATLALTACGGGGNKEMQSAVLGYGQSANRKESDTRSAVQGGGTLYTFRNTEIGETVQTTWRRADDWRMTVQQPKFDLKAIAPRSEDAGDGWVRVQGGALDGVYAQVTGGAALLETQRAHR